jgi:hypothetical protein
MSAVDSHEVVVVFGAGATKACDGPLTAEILPQAMQLRNELERDGQLAEVEIFLREHFHLPPAPLPGDYPDLPLLLSLIDTARERGESFGSHWETDRLDRLRESLEYAMFALLEYQLRDVPHRNPYRVLLESLFERPPASLTVVSLNYDIIVDNVLSSVVERATGMLPDYACDIATTQYRGTELLPLPDGKSLRLTLLKLHGSLNWMHCPNCHRLELGIADSGRRTVKALDMLWQSRQALRLAESYSRQGRMCEDCGARLRALLITPTGQKDYRNPHIARIWYTADRALRRAARVAFVGYSLPPDDVEVAYLFKRGLSHLDSTCITVVESTDRRVALSEHHVGRRYRNLFGDRIDWHPEGFGSWAASIASQNSFVY